MTDSHVSTANYSAVIADLRIKRAELDRTIAMLEAMANLGTVVQSEPKAPMPVREVVRFPIAAAIEVVPAPSGGNTGIGEACVQILMDVGSALSTREITDMLGKTGFPLTMANPSNNVWSALNHRAKIRGDVVREGRNWRYFRGQEKSPETPVLNGADVEHVSRPTLSGA